MIRVRSLRVRQHYPAQKNSQKTSGLTAVLSEELNSSYFDPFTEDQLS